MLRDRTVSPGLEDQSDRLVGTPGHNLFRRESDIDDRSRLHRKQPTRSLEERKA